MRRFLALGDSYTIGEGVTDQERWPHHLIQLLLARGATVSEPHIIARTAWTTDELADAIDGENPTGPFELVSLLIGVNDQYRSRPVKSFETEFAKLVTRARGFAGGDASRVVAISIPDWGATPFAEGSNRDLIAEEIGAYNTRACALATAAGAHWVDITGISREMLTDRALVAVDGLHPTGEMYRRWATHILPSALKALKVD